MNITLCLTTLRKYKRENSYKRLKKKPVEAPESPTEDDNKEEWVELSLDALKGLTGANTEPQTDTQKQEDHRRSLEAYKEYQTNII